MLTSKWNGTGSLTNELFTVPVCHLEKEHANKSSFEMFSALESIWRHDIVHKQNLLVWAGVISCSAATSGVLFCPHGLDPDVSLRSGWVFKVSYKSNVCKSKYETQGWWSAGPWVQFSVHIAVEQHIVHACILLISTTIATATTKRVTLVSDFCGVAAAASRLFSEHKVCGEVCVLFWSRIMLLIGLLPKEVVAFGDNLLQGTIARLPLQPPEHRRAVCSSLMLTAPVQGHSVILLCIVCFWKYKAKFKCAAIRVTSLVIK